MSELMCETCKQNISYSERIQRLDLSGYTHTYCKGCAEKAPKEKAPERIL